jgi:hypothetical protein
MSFYPPFHAFFLDTIQEIYNKRCFSFHLSKKEIHLLLNMGVSKEQPLCY